MIPDLVNADSLVRICNENLLYEILCIIREEFWKSKFRTQDFLVEAGGFLIFEGEIAAQHGIEDDAAAPKIRFQTIILVTRYHLNQIIRILCLLQVQHSRDYRMLSSTALPSHTCCWGRNPPFSGSRHSLSVGSPASNPYDISLKSECSWWLPWVPGSICRPKTPWGAGSLRWPRRVPRSRQIPSPDRDPPPSQLSHTTERHSDDVLAWVSWFLWICVPRPFSPWFVTFPAPLSPPIWIMDECMYW